MSDAKPADGGELRDEPTTRAMDELLPDVYYELRRMAAARMAREKPGQTLQATALVHEVWLRMAARDDRWRDRDHFLRVAANAMRRILIDVARRKQAVRHGGSWDKVPFDEIHLQAADRLSDSRLLRLDEVLDEFERYDARKADLVKYRYFIGFSLEQAAEALGISPRTAARDWIYAKAWLLERMGRED